MQPLERQRGHPPLPLDLSIIIVNWNTRDLLAQCLDSVISSRLSVSSKQLSVNSHQLSVTGEEGELITDHCSLITETIVVDNASGDGSARMVRERFPQARLIENSENLGFARANNQAIFDSSSRYVLLLNSDTMVHPGALETLVRFMDEHQEIGAVGARLLNDDGSVQLYPTESPTLANQLALLLPLSWHHRRWHGLAKISKPLEVERVKGAALAARRVALDEVGGLDERLFFYAEEDDLCLRLRQAGWKIFYLPDAPVTHYGGASTERTNPQTLLHLYRSKTIMLRKHRGELAAFIFKNIIWLSYMILWVLYNPRSMAKRTLRLKRQAYAQLLRAALRF